MVDNKPSQPPQRKLGLMDVLTDIFAAANQVQEQTPKEKRGESPRPPSERALKRLQTKNVRKYGRDL